MAARLKRVFLRPEWRAASHLGRRLAIASSGDLASHGMRTAIHVTECSRSSCSWCPSAGTRASSRRRQRASIQEPRRRQDLRRRGRGDESRICTRATARRCHGWAADGRKMDSQMPDGSNLRETRLDRARLVDDHQVRAAGTGHAGVRQVRLQRRPLLRHEAGAISSRRCPIRRRRSSRARSISSSTS